MARVAELLGSRVRRASVAVGVARRGAPARLLEPLPEERQVKKGALREPK
jgi:hypothetical protein